MAEFQGVSESFSVTLLSDEGGGSERVCCQIGLDGLFVQSPDGRRTLRKYPLNHISRWALRGTRLVLYTKTPVDVEERTVTLQGDERTIRSVLDTLTCCCMQMVELLQSKEGGGERQAASSISALLSASQKKLPTADEVAFWDAPEKAGWLQSQGEHLRTWRRRWFVLKDGFLFRFSGPDVSAGSKPRGIVDLSKVADATEARTETGKDNSLKLVTNTGSKVCYLADSETEQVEWLSALDGAVARILKQVAGVEDAPAPTPQGQRSQGGDWAAQLKDGYSSAASARSRYSASPGRGRDTVVRVTGYEEQEAEGRAPAPARGRAREEYGGQGGGSGYGSSYGASIPGVAGVRLDEPYRREYPQPANPASSFSDSFSRADPGYPSYPSLAPQSHAQPGAGYGGPDAGGPPQQYQQPPPLYSYDPPPQPAQPAYPGPHDLGATAAYQQQSYPAPQPQAPQQPPPPHPAEAAWQVHYSEGRPYYHNPQTGVTQWTPP